MEERDIKPSLLIQPLTKLMNENIGAPDTYEFIIEIDELIKYFEFVSALNEDETIKIKGTIEEFNALNIEGRISSAEFYAKIRDAMYDHIKIKSPAAEWAYYLTQRYKQTKIGDAERAEIDKQILVLQDKISKSETLPVVPAYDKPLKTAAPASIPSAPLPPGPPPVIPPIPTAPLPPVAPVNPLKFDWVLSYSSRLQIDPQLVRIMPALNDVNLPKGTTFECLYLQTASPADHALYVKSLKDLGLKENTDYMVDSKINQIVLIIPNSKTKLANYFFHQEREPKWVINPSIDSTQFKMIFPNIQARFEPVSTVKTIAKELSAVPKAAGINTMGIDAVLKQMEQDYEVPINFDLIDPPSGTLIDQKLIDEQTKVIINSLEERVTEYNDRMYSIIGSYRVPKNRLPEMREQFQQFTKELDLASQNMLNAIKILADKNLDINSLARKEAEKVYEINSKYRDYLLSQGEEWINGRELILGIDRKVEKRTLVDVKALLDSAIKSPNISKEKRKVIEDIIKSVQEKLDQMAKDYPAPLKPPEIKVDVFMAPFPSDPGAVSTRGLDLGASFDKTIKNITSSLKFKEISLYDIVRDKEGILKRDHFPSTLTKENEIIGVIHDLVDHLETDDEKIAALKQMKISLPVGMARMNFILNESGFDELDMITKQLNLIPARLEITKLLKSLQDSVYVPPLKADADKLITELKEALNEVDPKIMVDLRFPNGDIISITDKIEFNAVKLQALSQMIKNIRAAEKERIKVLNLWNISDLSDQAVKTFEAIASEDLFSKLDITIQNKLIRHNKEAAAEDERLQVLFKRFQDDLNKEIQKIGVAATQSDHYSKLASYIELGEATLAYQKYLSNMEKWKDKAIAALAKPGPFVVPPFDIKLPANRSNYGFHSGDLEMAKPRETAEQKEKREKLIRRNINRFNNYLDQLMIKLDDNIYKDMIRIRNEKRKAEYGVLKKEESLMDRMAKVNSSSTIVSGLEFQDKKSRLEAINLAKERYNLLLRYGELITHYNLNELHEIIKNMEKVASEANVNVDRFAHLVEKTDEIFKKCEKYIKEFDDKLKVAETNVMQHFPAGLQPEAINNGVEEVYKLIDSKYKEYGLHKKYHKELNLIIVSTPYDQLKILKNQLNKMSKDYKQALTTNDQNVIQEYENKLKLFQSSAEKLLAKMEVFEAQSEERVRFYDIQNRIRLYDIASKKPVVTSNAPVTLNEHLENIHRVLDPIQKSQKHIGDLKKVGSGYERDLAMYYKDYQVDINRNTGQAVVKIPPAKPGGESVSVVASYNSLKKQSSVATSVASPGDRAIELQVKTCMGFNPPITLNRTNDPETVFKIYKYSRLMLMGDQFQQNPAGVKFIQLHQKDIELIEKSPKFKAEYEMLKSLSVEDMRDILKKLEEKNQKIGLNLTANQIKNERPGEGKQPKLQ